MEKHMVTVDKFDSLTHMERFIKLTNARQWDWIKREVYIDVEDENCPTWLSWAKYLSKEVEE